MAKHGNGGERPRPRVAPLPFAAALGVSLVLHVGFFCALPSVDRALPQVDSIFVDLSLPQKDTPPPLSPPLENREVPKEAEGPRPPQPPESKVEPEVAASAQEGPAGRSPSAQAQRSAGGPPHPASETPLQAKAGSPGLREHPATAATSAASPEARRSDKSLKDLMPSGKDLSHFRSGPLPDPSGGTAREVTLGLGDGDVRYQGYVDKVRTEIYAGWHMGRGLVVAGAPRRVVVGFSLNALGMVGAPTVTQSSGNPTLDAEAVDAVRNAKISPFPNHWTVERLYLYAVFDYEFR